MINFATTSKRITYYIDPNTKEFYTSKNTFGIWFLTIFVFMALVKGKDIPVLSKSLGWDSPLTYIFLIIAIPISIFLGYLANKSTRNRKRKYVLMDIDSSEKLELIQIALRSPKNIRRVHTIMNILLVICLILYLITTLLQSLLLMMFCLIFESSLFFGKDELKIRINIAKELELEMEG
ncbi:hypothetical protein [Lactococcus kimchii]|uniref:hypothetical protein n=1 Tax=Lactococcus sp. S-13 TaxID=2507158 RepID=UPI0010238653|nr:hypothetical protein [Lactococcus sp. S-13]RZI49632.1 hypothetical protein EQJ87_09460 [Lactococcus sp. S-13]